MRANTFWLTHAVLALAAATAAAPAGAAAQDRAHLPIRQVVEDADGDGFADRLGDTVDVRGIVTVEAIVFTDEAAALYIEDRSGGTALFVTDPSQLTSLSVGDSVHVRGVLSHYRGGENLVVERLERVGAGTLPPPRDVLALEARREERSGELVRLEGVLRFADETTGWAQAELEDRSGTIPVAIAPFLLTDAGFVERLQRGGSVKLVGIVGQSSAESPPRGGYYVFPRTAEDMEFAPLPPYRALAGLAVVLVILWLGWWRRSTARRARAFEALSLELATSRSQLQEREALLRSLVENAADTVSVLGASGEVIYQSPSIERMLGWSPAELLGRDVMEFVHPGDAARTGEMLRSVLEGGADGRELDVRVRAVDGSWHTLEVLATNRLDDPAVRGVVCNARDITEHRALEERVRHADRMEVVGRLAGGIAHDFNNVLTALRGHAEMALDEMPEGSAGREDVEEVVRGANRAASLTRQLLAFSRQQVLKPRVVSPTRILREMIPMIRRLIGEHIELHVAIPGDITDVRVDPTQFEQVLMNLVVNARDAMPAGGRLTLELANDRITGAEADAHADPMEPGPYVRLTVADDGVGMSKDVLEHIFEPFFTTKERGKGTGLGLATLYGIVKQSGGHVRAHSRIGAGTRFDVLFPAEAGEREEDEWAEPESGGPDAPEGLVVLLVEDESAVRRLARRVLEKHRYQVLEADSPGAALDLAFRHRNAIDLLLTDVIMPEMSGPEMARALREEGIDLPTLYTSGYTDDDVIRHGVVAGEALFLEKPFTPEQLLRAVRSALSPRTVAPGTTAVA